MSIHDCWSTDRIQGGQIQFGEVTLSLAEIRRQDDGVLVAVAGAEGEAGLFIRVRRSTSGEVFSTEHVQNDPIVHLNRDDAEILHAFMRQVWPDLGEERTYVVSAEIEFPAKSEKEALEHWDRLVDGGPFVRGWTIKRDD